MVREKSNQTNKDTTLFRLLAYIKPYKFYLIFATLSAIISVTFTLLAPVLIGEAIDSIIGKDAVYRNKILMALTYLAMSIVVSGVFQWLMTFCTNKITYGVVKDLRRMVFDKLNEVPLKYIDKTSHGDVISRMVNDIDQISDGLLQGFAQLFTGIMTILGTLIFMFRINVTISLVVIILTPLSLLVASFISKRIYEKFKEQSRIRGELSGYIEEMIGNQKIVKTFNYEEKSQNKFKEINARMYSCGVMAQFYSSLTNPCARFVNGIVYAVVGMIGALNVISGNLSVGGLSSFLIYANQYTKPFNEISGVITELQAAFASARRVFLVMDEESESSDQNGIELSSCDKTVSLENVAFSYNKDVSLIEDLNLTVKAGQRVAIVGPTGCGKTTMINLLMRFYDVNKGEIRINNTNIKDLKRSNLRSMYGMVLQETWLYSASVRDNIAYGKEDATMDEIIQAAKSAHAHSFIKRLPKGYDTIITEEGGNISGGQKQLLCIARIMLTKPPMLILDEATSNIDTRTEIQIQKAFNHMMEGRTSFVVAHRLSTIREADTILVMDKGRIIEQGNHEELLKKEGFYANLYNSQFAVTE